MPSSSLVAQSSPFSLPVAQLRSVYQTHDVERKLAKLPERDHESLRTTYERMLERGPERFQVKPSGVPDMAGLYEAMPNFHEVLDDVKRHVALSQDSRDGLEVTPLLLLGVPGIGKTHFARKLADLLGTGMSLVPMSSMTAGWIVVDEIDKASGDAQYDPLGALYSLLEHDTAQNFTDEFAEVPIDASQVIWITTANDERSIPEPIRNRMNVFEVQAPSPEAARQIAGGLYRTICSEHDWGQRFAPEPHADVLDQLAELAPREMRRALMTAFGNARLDGRHEVRGDDFPRQGAGKTRMGFIQ